MIYYRYGSKNGRPIKEEYDTDNGVIIEPLSDVSGLSELPNDPQEYYNTYPLLPGVTLLTLQQYTTLTSQIDAAIDAMMGSQNMPPPGPISHVHDTLYSPIIHDHNTEYSEITHDHDMVYAPISHVTDPAPHVDTILAPFTFAIEGNGSTGMWLTAASRAGTPSNLAPAIAPADVILIASTYSNENDNSSFSLDFYVNGGATPAYTWDIVNARVGRKNHDETAMPPDFMLNRDDRLSLRVGALSSLPKDAFVILYFMLISDPAPGEFFLATI